MASSRRRGRSQREKLAAGVDMTSEVRSWGCQKVAFGRWQPVSLNAFVVTAPLWIRQPRSQRSSRRNLSRRHAASRYPPPSRSHADVPSGTPRGHGTGVPGRDVYRNGERKKKRHQSPGGCACGCTCPGGLLLARKGLPRLPSRCGSALHVNIRWRDRVLQDVGRTSTASLAGNTIFFKVLESVENIKKRANLQCLV